MNIRDAFTAIAAGDPAAFEFCCTFHNFVHEIDDGIDRDQPVNVESTVGNFLNVVGVLSKNSFWITNSGTLLPVVISGFLAYIDSNRMAASERVQDKVASQVLKSQYQDVYWMTAYLVGGWEHMLNMSRNFRDYDFDL